MNSEAYVFIATSLDGYIARKDGGLDWLPQDTSDNEDYGYQAFFDTMDALVMGRNTYEKVLSFGEWPYKNKPVFVLSHSQIDIPNEISSTVKAVSMSPEKLAGYLSEQGYNKLYIDGGNTIQSFLNANLVKELIVTTIPVILAEGIALFANLESEIKLELLECKSFPIGLVQNHYKVVHQPS